MRRRVAIIQSCYIPWRGYFSIIARCDVFIFLDSVQFTRRDWRSRNRIKTPQGPQWLSIPVNQKGQFHAPIDAISIADPNWAQQHLRSIEANYRRAQHFAEAFPMLEEAYLTASSDGNLSAINRALTASLCRLIGLSTPLMRDVDLLGRTSLETMDSTARLVELTASLKASEYLSGPAARTYLDEAAFKSRGIGVTWMDYGNLPEYQQLWGLFDPSLSIVDALLNLGKAGLRDAIGA